MLKRLTILGVLLCVLVFASTEPSSADAGGACLGQWSECRMGCEGASNQLWLQQCNSKCDYQRYKCLNGY